MTRLPRAVRRSVEQRARAVAEGLVPGAITDWKPHDLQGREPAALVPRLWAEMDRTYDLCIERLDDPELVAETVRELYGRSWSTVKGISNMRRIP